MYCAFCGKELPKGEGCTCCRAVAARNDNPNYTDRKTIFRTGTPLDFDHAHGVNYKVDEYGKFDSCQYGGEDHHTRPETRVNLDAPVKNTKTLVNGKPEAKKFNGNGFTIFVIILIIYYIIAMFAQK